MLFSDSFDHLQRKAHKNPPYCNIQYSEPNLVKKLHCTIQFRRYKQFKNVLYDILYMEKDGKPIKWFT